MTVYSAPSRVGGAISLPLRLADDRGVCLAEFIVALTTGVIVLAASFQIFTMLHAETLKQQRRLSQQQEVRIGLEVFEQEVRLATADSISIASSQELRFQANINSQRTTLTAPVMPGQSALPVLDGSGWGRGKSVLLCAGQACEPHNLLRDGQQYQLVVAEPIARAFPLNGSVEVINRVGYYIKRDDNDVLQLMRMVDGGANVLVAELKDLRLSYWDEDGRAAVMPSMIKRIVIEMTSSLLTKKTVREVSLRS
jgi:hypothetical protein